ncbi:MAG: dockerin type I repeat-containing protein, partial [Ruminococcus sp.]|nr:dockerin type I repeat-containing protein [Ruminococcus sp.]
IVYVYDNLYDILNPLKNRKNIRLFGDTNKDHKVNVSDAVLLQKYLHGKGYVGNEADLTRDGLIDSFDMVYMRKMILNNQ